MRLLLVAPVSGGERVLEAVCDDARLDGQLQVEVLALVDELLRVETDLLRQIAKQSTNSQSIPVILQQTAKLHVRMVEGLSFLFHSPTEQES